MNPKNIGGFEGGDMKQLQLLMELEQLLRQGQPSAHGGVGTRSDGDARLFGFGDGYDGEVSAADLGFLFEGAEHQKGLPRGGVVESHLWSPSITQMQPCISAIDSPSSFNAGTPTSKLTAHTEDTKARPVMSGSSGDQSDEDDYDAEIETNLYGQSNDPGDLKRMRRKVSNRNSARRSRKRRQAQLTELETQVDVLSGKKDNLCKQFALASQQLKEASTDNRVLKSDVEALRAKVKLAEEMVTHGTLSCNLNNLLHHHHSLSPHLLNSHNLSRPTNISPSFTLHGTNNPLSGMGFNPHNGNMDTLSRNADTVSCESELCPWESQISTVSN